MERKRHKKTGRIHLRVDESLYKGLHAYAQKHGISLSEIATRLFNSLLEKDKEDKLTPEAEQI